MYFFNCEHNGFRNKIECQKQLYPSGVNLWVTDVNLIKQFFKKKISRGVHPVK